MDKERQYDQIKWTYNNQIKTKVEGFTSQKIFKTLNKKIMNFNFINKHMRHH